MNKKPAINLLFLSILLCSCQGTSLSYTEAKEYLDEIELKLKNNEISYLKYATTIERVKNSTRIFYQYSTFDNANNYFHSYTLTLNDENNQTYDIVEQWKYVKKSQDELKIYFVSRKNGNSDNKGNPIFEKSIIDYNEDEWNSIINDLNKTLNEVLLFSVNQMQNFIIDEENNETNNFNFSSTGENNLSVSGDKDNVIYYYLIEDCYLRSYSVKESETLETFSANYSKVNVYYPSVE